MLRAPFTWYAVQYFDHHLSLCKILPVDIIELLDGLLQQDGEIFAAVIQTKKWSSKGNSRLEFEKVSIRRLG
jgi:hypothetical protein